MIARVQICPRELLPKVVADNLSSVELEHISEHLEACPQCQQELELLSGGPQWSSRVQHLLSSAVLELDDSWDQDDRSDDAWRALLEPSDDPTKLGRIGNYEVESLIGRGGFGTVFKAFDRELNRYVAIKVLTGPAAHSAIARKRFLREARAAAAVVHDHVMPIHSIEISGNGPLLVMPLLAGRSLQQRLDAEGTLCVEEVLRIGMQTARGLAAAHAQGLIHRDIKPSNILLENGVERVRISDFGLARAVDDASQTQSGFIAGTPAYMAPEQARGEPLDSRADLFSLGSVMYAMCAGHPPFRAETTLAVLRRICDDQPRDLREHNPRVPDWLCHIIARLLAKLPEQRFQSANEAADLLGRWLAHVQHPTSVAAPERQRRTWPQPRRKLLAGLAAIAGLVALLIFVTLSPTWWQVPEKHESPSSSQQSSTVARRPLEAGLGPAQFQAELQQTWQELLAAEPQVGHSPASPSSDQELQHIRSQLDRLEREFGITATDDPGDSEPEEPLN